MEPVYQISDDFVLVTKSTIFILIICMTSIGYNTILIENQWTKKQIDKQHLKRKKKKKKPQAKDERNRISRCHL